MDQNPVKSLGKVDRRRLPYRAPHLPQFEPCLRPPSGGASQGAVARPIPGDASLEGFAVPVENASPLRGRPEPLRAGYAGKLWHGGFRFGRAIGRGLIGVDALLIGSAVRKDVAMNQQVEDTAQKARRLPGCCAFLFLSDGGRTGLARHTVGLSGATSVVSRQGS